MRNKARPTKKFQAKTQNTQEDRMDKMIEDLQEFEQFREQIIKSVRKDLLSGMSAEELRKKYLPLITARMVSEALTTADPAKAAAIAKDLTDRAEGKAIERKEIKLKYEDLSDEELDALLESEEAELKDMTTRGPTQ